MASKVMAYGPNGRYNRDKWRARVKEDGRENFLGLFDSAEEAERVEREYRAGK